ncbi:MAG TPA: RICIN domain-containing protein, partial [Terracidiphilus sp.]
TPPTTGSYTELISDNSGMCLSAVDTTEGTQLEQATCTGSALQLWDVTAEGSGYNITNEATGYVADDSGNSKTAGGVVIDWAKNGGTNQEWTFSSNGSGDYTIVNVSSGLCLDVTGASKTSGALIDQWTCNGGANQLWKQQ